MSTMRDPWLCQANTTTFSWLTAATARAGPNGKTDGQATASGVCAGLPAWPGQARSKLCNAQLRGGSPTAHLSTSRRKPEPKQRGTKEAPRKHPGGTQKAPRRHPGGTQEAPKRHPRGTQEAPKRHPGGTQSHQGLQRGF